jgi:hypothetical protein
MRTFDECESLVHINFPNALIQIDHYAFSRCTSLTSADLPKGITKIGSGAFYSCSTLSFVNMPSELEDIGDYAFFECKSICKVYLPRRLLNLGREAFSGCSAITHIHLPQGLKVIAHSTFLGCKSLVQVCIPRSVELIFSGAFEKCTSLVHVIILNSSIDIASGCFADCDSLVNLYRSIRPKRGVAMPPLESNSTSTHSHQRSGNNAKDFNDWLKNRCDSYPFWYKCWTDRVSMKDVEAVVEKYGIDGIFKEEEYTGMSAFDVLLSNPFLGDRYFELIAIIIVNLLGSYTPPPCNPQKRKRVK